MNYQSPTPVTTASGSTAHFSPTSASVGPHDNECSPTEAEHALQLFRTHHLKLFPFLYIPDGTTVEELQQQKPFLWLTIRAVCTKSLTRQNELGIKIRETLAKQVVVEGERSMDLLQGTLVFISWLVSCMYRKLFITS